MIVAIIFLYFPCAHAQAESLNNPARKAEMVVEEVVRNTLKRVEEVVK